jgi:hypothetical protein
MVGLRDGSAWRIWPDDIPKTLQWLPTTEIDIADIDDEICSHALIDRSNGSRVRVRKRQRALARPHRPPLPPPGLSSRHACGEWTCPVWSVKHSISVSRNVQARLSSGLIPKERADRVIAASGRP